MRRLRREQFEQRNTDEHDEQQDRQQQQQPVGVYTRSEEEYEYASPPPHRVAASPYNSNRNHNHDYDYDDNGSIHSDHSSNSGTPSKDMTKLRRNSQEQLLLQQQQLQQQQQQQQSSSRRSSSFGDAEEYLKAITGGVAQVGYYQSFTMDSPLPNHNHSQISNGINNEHDSGMHHRHNHHYHDEHDFPQQHLNNNSNNNGTMEEDESPTHRLMRQRQFLSPIHKNHAIKQLHSGSYNNDHHHNDHYYHHPPSSSSSLLVRAIWMIRSSRVARWCLGIGLSCYILFIVRSTYFLGTSSYASYDADEESYFQFGMDHNRYQAYYSSHSRNSNPAPPRKNTRGYYTSSYNYYNYNPNTIPKWYTEQVQQSDKARIKQKRQQSQRLLRTQPKRASSSSSLSLSLTLELAMDTIAGIDTTNADSDNSWHQIASLDERQQQPQQQQPNDEEEEEDDEIEGEGDDRASMDELCGYSAQHSVLHSSQHYPARAALNEDSRVVITGILSPLGMSLALKLKEQCGVRYIAGVDSMYPNTVLNRLLLAQERIQLLSTNIPKLYKQQIHLPFLGLDPKSKPPKKSTANNKNNVDGDIGENESPDGANGFTTSALNQNPQKKSIDEEMAWMQSFEPTHVVHLSSYSMDVIDNEAMMDPKWKNTRSPYTYTTSTSTTSNSGGGNDGGSGSGVDNQQQQQHQPYFYPLRSGMVSMEQLLTTISAVPEKERPQFIYATTARSTTEKTKGSSSSRNSNHDPNNNNNNREALFRTMKQMDEVLAETYHSQYGQQGGVPSIGVRLPTAIYGPWGYAGSTMHDLMEQAVQQQQHGGTTTTTTANTNTNTNLDLLYVDDAVDAIISALQHRPDAPTTVTVPSETTASSKSVASLIHSVLLRGNGHSGNSNNNNDNYTNNDNAAAHRLLESEEEEEDNHVSSSLPLINGDNHDNNRYRKLKWKDVQDNHNNHSHKNSAILPASLSERHTPLQEGLLKALAWHLDRVAPYGPAPVETGDELLQRHDVQTCGPFEIDCHKSNDYLPCNSECNIHDHCLPSIFDETRDLMYNVSEGCDIVLYTQSLGYNVDDMELHGEYMDDKDLDDEELLVCNFAIVPRESDLVSLVANKVPNSQLAKFGIEPHPSDRSSKNMRDRKLQGLNGRLLYRGWILIWVKDAMHDLTAPDASLLKLSPSKFFHPTVSYGLFVEDNFKVSPNLDDVLFLTEEMKRRKLSDRSLKKEEAIKGPHGTITQKVKYHIPQEPARRAAMLFAPLRYPETTDDPLIEQYREGRRKLTVYDASKFMRYEVGYQQGEKESPSQRRQREYYERLPSYINKNTELRSTAEPWYRYSMKHWVRSRWVLHDFTVEDARLLRCDWYQEHVQWGNDLDQLSFANVMAVRELKRRIAHHEPDDHVKTFIKQHPELHDLTDSYEWHAMETEVNKLHREPTQWKSQQQHHQQQHQQQELLREQVVQQQQVSIDGQGKVHETSKEENEDEETPLYVRIMSERVMGASRRIWARMRKKQEDAKKRQTR